MNYEQKFIEIPFGAKDSELKGWEYTIPDGTEAIVKDGKVIVKEKESEDEKIREEIIAYFDSKALAADETEFLYFERWIAYLEKLNEQKPIEWSKDEKIRKWLIRTLKALNTSGVSIDGAYEMLLPSIDYLEKQKEHKSVEHFDLTKLLVPAKLPKEQKSNDINGGEQPLHWRTIEDATTKRTDDGCCVTTEKMLIKGLIDDEDYRIVDKDTMVNRHLLCVPVKELNAQEKHKEQKPAEWNEDDELMRKRCIVDLGYLTEYEQQYKERYDAQINWLKSLRPSWKPSEEQMEALKNVPPIESIMK